MQSANDTLISENPISSTVQKSTVTKDSNDSGINEDVVQVSEARKSNFGNHSQENLALDAQVSNKNHEVNHSTKKENGDSGGDIHRLNDNIHSKNQVVNNVNTNAEEDEDTGIGEEVEDSFNQNKETNGEQRNNAEAREENLQNEQNKTDYSALRKDNADARIENLENEHNKADNSASGENNAEFRIGNLQNEPSNTDEFAPQENNAEARIGSMRNESNKMDDTAHKEEEEEKEDEWLDVLGSGQLKKHVLRKAENGYRPQNLQICEVNIEGKLEDGSIFENLERFRFQLGDNEVVQGLDLVIPLMDVGEEALIEVGPRFAYGFPGLPPKIPCDATLTYKVELLSAENEPDLDTLTVSERRKIGNKKRERGNWWFERENYTIAIQCYRRAVEYLDEREGGIQIEKEEESKEVAEDVHSLLEDRLKVFNNLAAAQMKIRSFDLALESVEKVLHCQPQNVKALFRKGKILAAKGETSEAISIVRQASQLEPDSKTIKQELQRLLNINKRETKIEKNMYKRMLGQKVRPDINNSKPSKFTQLRWGVVFGSIAAMVAGVVAYRYKFL